jgi:hypothetical protein
MSVTRYLAISGVLLAGCSPGPGDPGVKFRITNKCAADIEFNTVEANVEDRWIPVKPGATVRLAGGDVLPSAYVFLVRWLDGSGERRFSPETAVVELSGDRCPNR